MKFKYNPTTSNPVFLWRSLLTPISVDWELLAEGRAQIFCLRIFGLRLALVCLGYKQ